MHEMSIALGIVEVATQACQRAQKLKVTEIGLQIGTLAGIEIDALEFVWPAAVKDTVLENARKTIEHIPGMAICLECEQEFEVRAFYDACPKCGSYFKDIKCGKELKVKYLEV